MTVCRTTNALMCFCNLQLPVQVYVGFLAQLAAQWGSQQGRPLLSWNMQQQQCCCLHTVSADCVVDSVGVLQSAPGVSLCHLISWSQIG